LSLSITMLWVNDGLNSLAVAASPRLIKGSGQVSFTSEICNLGEIIGEVLIHLHMQDGMAVHKHFLSIESQSS
jgi:hypothetical protein